MRLAGVDDLSLLELHAADVDLSGVDGPDQIGHGALNLVVLAVLGDQSSFGGVGACVLGGGGAGVADLDLFVQTGQCHGLDLAVIGKCVGVIPLGLFADDDLSLGDGPGDVLGLAVGAAGGPLVVDRVGQGSHGGVAIGILAGVAAQGVGSVLGQLHAGLHAAVVDQIALSLGDAALNNSLGDGEGQLLAAFLLFVLVIGGHFVGTGVLDLVCGQSGDLVGHGLAAHGGVGHGVGDLAGAGSGAGELGGLHELIQSVLGAGVNAGGSLSQLKADLAVHICLVGNGDGKGVGLILVVGRGDGDRSIGAAGLAQTLQGVGILVELDQSVVLSRKSDLIGLTVHGLDLVDGQRIGLAVVVNSQLIVAGHGDLGGLDVPLGGDLAGVVALALDGQGVLAAGLDIGLSGHGHGVIGACRQLGLAHLNFHGGVQSRAGVDRVGHGDVFSGEGLGIAGHHSNLGGVGVNHAVVHVGGHAVEVAGSTHLSHGLQGGFGLALNGNAHCLRVCLLVPLVGHSAVRLLDGGGGVQSGSFVAVSIGLMGQLGSKLRNHVGLGDTAGDGDRSDDRRSSILHQFRVCQILHGEGELICIVYNFSGFIDGKGIVQSHAGIGNIRHAEPANTVNCRIGNDVHAAEGSAGGCTRKGEQVFVIRNHTFTRGDAGVLGHVNRQSDAGSRFHIHGCVGNRELKCVSSACVCGGQHAQQHNHGQKQSQ